MSMERGKKGKEENSAQNVYSQKKKKTSDGTAAKVGGVGTVTILLLSTIVHTFPLIIHLFKLVAQ